MGPHFCWLSSTLRYSICAVSSIVTNGIEINDCQCKIRITTERTIQCWRWHSVSLNIVYILQSPTWIERYNLLKKRTTTTATTTHSWMKRTHTAKQTNITMGKQKKNEGKKIICQTISHMQFCSSIEMVEWRRKRHVNLAVNKLNQIEEQRHRTRDWNGGKRWMLELE